MMPHFQIKKDEYQRIEQRFRCAHEKEEMRRRIIADGRLTYVLQCVRCGHTSSPFKAATVEKSGKEIPPYNDNLQDRWRKLKSLAYDEARHRLRPELRLEYQRYRLTDDWRKLRDQVIARESGMCEICQAPIEEVHHLTYVRIGSELLTDLMGLCTECHGLIHGKLPT